MAHAIAKPIPEGSAQRLTRRWVAGLTRERTCIPGSGLYDDALSWDELALLFRNLDHPLRNPIFHRASGRDVLQLPN